VTKDRAYQGGLNSRIPLEIQPFLQKIPVAKALAYFTSASITVSESLEFQYLKLNNELN